MYNSTRFNNLLNLLLNSMEEGTNPFTQTTDEFKEEILGMQKITEDGTDIVAVAFHDKSFSFVTEHGYGEITPDDKEYKEVLISLLHAAQQ